MRFYDRESELYTLREIQQRSLENAQMTVLIGRRRIGKTKLLLKATEGQTTLYFFVARKTENLLCQDFQEEIASVLGVPMLGEADSFRKIFIFLMELSKQRPFNLIIDEFQEFYNINPSVYSDMQNIWDQHKDQSKLNLYLSGSIYSLMHKIFESYKEPLFGRATNRIILRPFKVSVLKQIMEENHPGYSAEDLLALYAFTGGVAKYVELFTDSHALTYAKMVNLMTKENSSFLLEGRNILIEEFGKDYATYFSILSYISNGINSRGEIEGHLQREIGGYLARLENDFSIISKVRPMFAKAETKNVRYVIEDNFLCFWFRFFYKYIRFIESENYGSLNEIVRRDYPTYSGRILERYFRDKMKESKQFTNIGGYWDRKGLNEIDIIAIDELNHKAVVAEVKRNPVNISMEKLIAKTAALTLDSKQLHDYKIDYKGFSMEDL
ncbi:MAG: ATP-binding protein, partial [Bacteroidota bacterium]|nr:ATP-binding protein [Bacteroidota bacterium]